MNRLSFFLMALVLAFALQSNAGEPKKQIYQPCFEKPSFEAPYFERPALDRPLRDRSLHDKNRWQKAEMNRDRTVRSFVQEPEIEPPQFDSCRDRMLKETPAEKVDGKRYVAVTRPRSEARYYSVVRNVHRTRQVGVKPKNELAP